MDIYGPENVVLDPTFPNEAAYLAQYDYDLVGTPVGLSRDFLRNPAGYLKSIVSRYKVELVCSPVVFFIGYVLMLSLKATVHNLLFFMKGTKTLLKEKRRANTQRKAREAEGLPPDWDLQAHAIYRALTKMHEVKSGTDNEELLKYMTEYEAGRFALEAAWALEPGLLTLLEADPMRSFEDEPVEGAEADEEQERILAEMEEEESDESEESESTDDSEDESSEESDGNSEDSTENKEYNINEIDNPQGDIQNSPDYGSEYWKEAEQDEFDEDEEVQYGAHNLQNDNTADEASISSTKHAMAQVSADKNSWINNIEKKSRLHADPKSRWS